MQLQITGKHIDVTDAIKEFIEKKFARLEKHFENIISTHVTLGVEKERHIAEGIINIAKHEIIAKVEAESMYAALDLLTDKLDRQLIKNKEKMKDHHHEKVLLEVEADEE